MFVTCTLKPAGVLLHGECKAHTSMCTYSVWGVQGPLLYVYVLCVECARPTPVSARTQGYMQALYGGDADVFGSDMQACCGGNAALFFECAGAGIFGGDAHL